MAGGFSIQGLQLHKVLQGAHNRYRELQDEDWKVEKQRRDDIVAQLSGLIPHARTGVDIEAINADIAQIMEAPREKQARSKLLKTPSTQVPKPAQPQQGAGTGAGGATPPPFDFKQLAAALMGAPEQSGLPDVPQSAGGPPDSISAMPPAGAVPPTSTQPAQMVPPVGAGSLGATGAPTPPVAGLTPPAVMPQVQTPPGRSVPEPSPLVGTLPGTPSPQTAMATPPPMGATPSPTPRSSFMGYEDRARLPFELASEFGVTKSGQSITPRLTIEELRDKTERELRVKESRAAASIDLQEAQRQLAMLRSAGLTPGTPQFDAAQRRTDIATARLALAEQGLDLDRQELELRERNAGSFVPLTDDYGVVTGAWNPKTGGYATPPVAGARKAAIPTGERESASTADGMVMDLRRAEELAQRFSGEIGPVSGRMSSIASKFTEQDPDLNELQQIIGSLKNRLIYLKSGKQINESEYKRLADTMPSMEQPLSRFFTNLSRMEIEMGQIAARNAAKRSGAPSGSRMSKTQTNTRTGARRTVYSDDGGRTWHP